MKVDRETRRFLRRSSLRANTFGDISLGARTALRALQTVGAPFNAMDVATLSKVSSPVATLTPTETFQVESPRKHGEAPISTSGELEERRAWMVENCLAAGWSSAFVVKDRVAIPDQYARSAGKRIADDRLLVWHGSDGKAIVYRGRNPEEREHGICLFGAGTFNWYHWLVEQLPAAFLAERLGAEFGDIPFVVPEESTRIASFRDSLALFSRERPVQTIGAEPCRFKKLIVMDTPIEEPFNMVHGRWPVPSDYRFGPDTMRAYRAAIVERLGVEKRAPTRRIYLARRHGRRAYNQNELLDVATHAGFEAAYPEEMTFREQVQMMHDAKAVIGPSGAAFANSLFCQPGTQLLSWLIPEYRGFCSYTNLASIAQSEIRYLFPAAEAAVSGTRDAFTATYHMDPEEFRRALTATIAAADEKSP